MTDGKFPDFQAYRTLRIGYSLLFITAGLDKFFELFVNWNRYLAQFVIETLGIGSATIMAGAGILEIFIGVLIAFRPRIGGYAATFWFWAIIVNFMLIPGYYDIALRDFVLSLGAWALAKLSEEFE